MPCHIALAGEAVWPWYGGCTGIAIHCVVAGEDWNDHSPEAGLESDERE